MSNMQARQATIHRKTSETDIELFLCPVTRFWNLWLLIDC